MNNPLQRYFRKPSVYIKLLSTDDGYDDHILAKNPTGEHAVYSMTALNEITARTPDALYNGTAVVDIIQSCIPDIKDAWELKVQDLDAVLVAIRIASSDGTVDIGSECPACKTVAEYTIELGMLLSNLKSGDYSTPINIDDFEIKLASPTYKDLNEITKQQFELQRQYNNIDNLNSEEEKINHTTQLINGLTLLTIRLLSSSIEYIKTFDVYVNEREHIYDFLQNCDRKIYNEIRDHASKLRDASSLKPMKIQCQNCSHQYDQMVNMNVSDFFD